MHFHLSFLTPKLLHNRFVFLLVKALNSNQHYCEEIKNLLFCEKTEY
jgi:hypothetical protein